MTSETKPKKRKDKKTLPEHLETQRTRVICGPDVNYHTSTQQSASAYMALGVDNSWDLEEFKDTLRIVVNRMEDDVMEFDIIGIDASVANALRRILIAEVPTVAIEHVFVINNTSIIQDEVLAHRLGLIPLRIDPSKLEYRAKEEAATERNTVVFKLNVACTRSANGSLVNEKVSAKALQYLPTGSEIPDEASCRFAADQRHMFDDPADAPRPVVDDILLAKLRLGQAIELEAHCTKGIGKEHAKWSPVATAWYRLHPEVVLLKDVRGQDADKLKQLAPELFEFERVPGESLDTSPDQYDELPGPMDVDKETAPVASTTTASPAKRPSPSPSPPTRVRRIKGHERLRVTSARGNEKHLEKIRTLTEDGHWAKLVQVRKVKNHFIFTIESTGILKPQELFQQAIQILAQKCDTLSGAI